MNYAARNNLRTGIISKEVSNEDDNPRTNIAKNDWSKLQRLLMVPTNKTSKVKESPMIERPKIQTFSSSFEGTKNQVKDVFNKGPSK